MAFMFGVVIMMLAHVSAAAIKKSEPGKPYWLAAPAICLLMIGVSLIAGYFRSLFIQEVGTANVSPVMMAVLNFFIFIAGFCWSLVMGSKIPLEKRRAYESLYNIVRSLEKKIKTKETELSRENSIYLSNIDQANATKLHQINQEVQGLNYIQETKRLEEKRLNYEKSEKLFEESNRYLKIFLDHLIKKFQADILFRRQTLMTYFPEINLGPEPFVDIPPIFLPLADEYRSQIKKSLTGNPSTTFLSIILLVLLPSFFFFGCNPPKQQKYDIAVMVDQTEENQKLADLISPDGILEIMDIRLKDAGNSTGYGRISFYEINSFSLNKTRKIELDPMGFDETAVLRKKAVERFTTNLSDQWKMCFSTPQGEDKTSIYLPVVEAAKSMSADTETKKIIIIVSDMIENSDISFYRANLADEKQQAKFKEEFLVKAPVPDLKGYQIYIIYAPRNTQDDEKFRTASSFWKTWFETMNAEVIIKGNL